MGRESSGRKRARRESRWRKKKPRSDYLSRELLSGHRLYTVSCRGYFLWRLSALTLVASFSLIHASNLILQLLKSSSRKLVVEATILFLWQDIRDILLMQIHKDACIKHPRNAHFGDFSWKIYCHVHMSWFCTFYLWLNLPLWFICKPFTRILEVENTSFLENQINAYFTVKL